METIEQIKKDEGYSSDLYLCTEGKVTWLYGRNVEDRPITKKEWRSLKSCFKSGEKLKSWADFLFSQEIVNISDELNNLYGFTGNENKEEALIIVLNLAYNMGTTRFNPLKWPKFFKALKEKNYKQAAIEGRDSKWFHQVGQRSVRLMNSLENIT